MTFLPSPLILDRLLFLELSQLGTVLVGGNRKLYLNRS